MKTLSALFCGLMLAVLPSALHAQQVQYVIDKITPSLIQTPVYQFQGEVRQPVEQNAKWLEIEVRFKAAPETTDEMTFQYYVLLSTNILLVGEVTHVNIPKGNELYSVMYVSPRTLSRYFAGKPVTVNDIQNVGVQLIIKGQPVAEKSSKPGSQPQWFAPYQKTTGLLLNKSETPFAPLYWDRYEAIKPAGH